MLLYGMPCPSHLDVYIHNSHENVILDESTVFNLMSILSDFPKFNLVEKCLFI
jgi:hypothetical protein